MRLPALAALAAALFTACSGGLEQTTRESAEEFLVLDGPARAFETQLAVARSKIADAIADDGARHLILIGHSIELVEANREEAVRRSRGQDEGEGRGASGSVELIARLNHRADQLIESGVPRCRLSA